METKNNAATAQRPKGGRYLDAPLISTNIFSFIKKIKKEKKWKDTDRNAITIFKTNGLRIVLIALHKGAEMVRHTARGKISVQILSGKIKFNTDTQSIKLNMGQLLTLHEEIPHSLLAKKKTVFLLTLTTSLIENNYAEEFFKQEFIF